MGRADPIWVGRGGCYPAGMSASLKVPAHMTADECLACIDFSAKLAAFYRTTRLAARH